MRRFFTSISAITLLAACGGGGDAITPPPASPDFALAAASAAVSTNAGEQVSTNVSITRTGGFTGAVALVLEGAPAGVIGTFTPNPATGATSSLGIATTTAVTPGTYTLTVRGTATGVTDRTATVVLSVAAAPAFALSATNVTVVQGSVGASAITIARSGSFAGAVNLSTANVPANVTAAFSQNAPSGNAVTLSFTVGAGATPGVYPVTINGTGTGVANQSTTLTLTITASSSGGQISWQFCDVDRVPDWFAFRDGTSGTWTRVTVGAANTFTLTLTQNVGAIAQVLISGGNPATEVFFGTREELQAAANQECVENPAPGKSLTGLVAGLTAGEAASIFHGGASADVTFAAPTYLLTNVTSGNQDLFAVRTVTTTTAPITTTVNRMFLQRNVNVGGGGPLPVVDFAGGASFAPATATVQLANVGSDQLFFGESFRSANGTEAEYFADVFSTGFTRTFYGVPTNLLAAGDLHGAFVAASSVNGATSELRAVNAYFRAVADRTLTLGPVLATVTLSSSTTSGLARPKARWSIQSEYGDFASATFSQNSGSRSISLNATRAYFLANSEFELETPNFVGISGFDTAWGLVNGVAVTAEIFAFGAANGDIDQPTDGTTQRFAARQTSFTP